MYFYFKEEYEIQHSVPNRLPNWSKFGHASIKLDLSEMWAIGRV